MRTVQVTRFGDPDVLQPREAPDPQPGAGEVLIAVEVVEVLVLETQLRAGPDRVRPISGQRVPLSRAAEAHEAMALRAVIGKSVLIA